MMLVAKKKENSDLGRSGGCHCVKIEVSDLGKSDSLFEKQIEHTNQKSALGVITN